VQQHRQHHAVRGIAVHAAQHATEIPLLARQLVNRRIGAVDAGLEKDVQIQPARHHQPHQEVRDRTEVIQRIEPVAEGEVEQRLDAQEHPLTGGMQPLQQTKLLFRPRRGGMKRC